MNKDRIMNRLQQHLDAVRESGQDWLGIFLQGSQNYGLDYESSDIFTPYYILNPIYADLFQPIWDAREDIARYNNYAGMSCLLGMALEKQKAMEHPYPATIDKVGRFGYDPKQLHHALRMREFMTRYMADEKYSDCLVSKQADYLVEVKRGCHSLEEARRLMQEAVDSMKADKQQYMDTTPVCINEHANEVMQTATVEILKRCFLMELQGGE